MVGIHNFNHPMPKACFLCINHLTTHQEKLQHKPTCIHVLARVYEPQTTTTIFRAYILHQSLKLLQTSKTRSSPSNIFKLLILASRTMSPVPRSNPCNWVGHQQHFNCNFRHFSKTPNWTRSIDDWVVVWAWRRVRDELHLNIFEWICIVPELFEHIRALLLFVASISAAFNPVE